MRDYASSFELRSLQAESHAWIASSCLVMYDAVTASQASWTLESSPQSRYFFWSHHVSTCAHSFPSLDFFFLLSPSCRSCLGESSPGFALDIIPPFGEICSNAEIILVKMSLLFLFRPLPLSFHHQQVRKIWGEGRGRNAPIPFFRRRRREKKLALTKPSHTSVIFRGTPYLASHFCNFILPTLLLVCPDASAPTPSRSVTAATTDLISDRHAPLLPDKGGRSRDLLILPTSTPVIIAINDLSLFSFDHAKRSLQVELGGRSKCVPSFQPCILRTHNTEALGFSLALYYR